MAVSPRFSVLLPTRNRADILHFSIQSVLAQTLPDFELLIAGDGCTDHTADVVRSFTDPRIRWLDLPKAPHFGYANRNVALRQARGELIAYIAHDDVWLPDHLALLQSSIVTGDAEFAYSLLLVVSPDGVITPKIENLYDDRNMQRVASMESGLGISCVIHRRECLERYGYWNESMPRGADNELWVRIIKGGGRTNFAYLPIPTALHFLAKWRKQTWRNKVLLKVLQLEGSLPPELVIPVPAGMPEQQAIWDNLNRDLSRRTRELRAAVQLHLDRLASAPYPSSWLTFAYQQYRKLV